MFKRLFGPRLVVAVLVGVSLLAAPGASAVEVRAYAVAGAIDRTSRSAVVDAYKTQLRPALNTPVGWSGGSVDTCDAGAESAASRDATIEAVNYYRSMVGLPQVTNNTDWNDKAQKAALIMHANSRLSHYPTPDWDCYSPEGAEGAAASNIALGLGAAKAVEAYMIDYGDHNFGVGHRRWVLYPPATRFGTGSTPQANALWVFDDVQQPRPLAADVDWVAWPPSDFVPWEALPHRDAAKTLFRWSLSSNALPAAIYDDAVVSMTFGDEQLDVVQEYPDNDPDQGYAGDTTLVWNATRSGGERFPIEDDASFTVTVTGIRDGVTTLEPLIYTVEAVRAVPDTTPPPKTGYPFLQGKVGAAEIMWSYNADYPAHADRKGVEVRIRAGSTAPTLDTGRQVCRVLVPANTCVARNLEPGVHYQLGLWAFDYADNISKRQIAYMSGSTVTASAPDSVKKGSAARISGYLYHGKPSARTLLSGSNMMVAQARERAADGSWGTWQTFATPYTSSGAYAVNFPVHKKTQFRVKFEGNQSRIGDISPTKTVRVG